MDRVYRFNWRVDDFSISAFEDALKNFHAKDGFMYWRISGKKLEENPSAFYGDQHLKIPLINKELWESGKSSVNVLNTSLP